MLKIEQIRAAGTQGGSARPHLGPFRTNVVPISWPDRATSMDMAAPNRGFALGRKGRRARLRRQLLDVAFIATAVGTAALLLWTSV